ncbi:MAG: ABC transporter ATP-binding protein, partial [Lentisphaeria bacterium]|nr:ABC transporter ATP-binding protein [Lentisphaeria bacterium]
MATFLKKIWTLLEKREKIVFFFLLFLMCTGAYLELMGIGLVLPIIAALTNPVLLQDNKLLNLIYKLISPSSNKEFMLVMCLIVSGLFFVKTVFFLFLTKVQAEFSNNSSKKLEERLFSAYIKAPYLYHLNKSSAEIFSNLNQMRNTFPSFLTSIMLLITEFICVSFIFISLFIFTPGATLAVIFVAAAGFLFIVLVVKRYGNELGKQEYAATILANKIIMETFTSMKEVKLYGCENNFVSLHSDTISQQKKFAEKIAIFIQAPRFIIEFVMVLGAMFLLIAFIFFNVSSTSILLKLSLISIALIRLMPSFSRIQYNYTNVKILSQSFDGILFDLFNTQEENTEEKNLPFTFHNSIEVKNISFGYLPGKTILKDISFTIPKNSSCAFIGKTGCGKTTLADI